MCGKWLLASNPVAPASAPNKRPKPAIANHSVSLPIKVIRDRSSKTRSQHSSLGDCSSRNPCSRAARGRHRVFIWRNARPQDRAPRADTPESWGYPQPWHHRFARGGSDWGGPTTRCDSQYDSLPLLDSGARIRAARAGRCHPWGGPTARDIRLSRPRRWTGSAFPDQASGFVSATPLILPWGHTTVKPGHVYAPRHEGHACRRRPRSRVPLPRRLHRHDARHRAFGGRCLGNRCGRVPASTIPRLVEQSSFQGKQGAARGLHAVWRRQAPVSRP